MKEKIHILLAAVAVSMSLWASDKGKKTWPEEWRNVKYAKQENLPDARINKGEATVKVRLLNYDPTRKLSLMVGGFQPLGQKETFRKTYPLADDGTATARVPLWLVRSAIVGIEDVAFAPVLLAPGETVEVLMDARGGDCCFLAFKGYMARTNMERAAEYERCERDRETISRAVVSALSPF